MATLQVPPMSDSRERRGSRSSFGITPSRLGFVDDSEKLPLTPVGERFQGYRSQWAARPDSIESVEDLVTKVLHADDDPNLSPWTFRIWVVGEQSHSPTRHHGVPCVTASSS